ncbi:MAG: holo-[acyl-carrier-protein] synthase [FCB group bacterium]|nr:holo-[acyl-carrier-protein] synthase [FCB group bacterium]
MIKAIGLDLVEIRRIRDDLTRFQKKFVDRILGDEEKIIYEKRHNKDIFLAGRLAAKEAVIKCLNNYLAQKPLLTEIQVINGSSGEPILKLPQEIKQKLKSVNCLISITHEKQYAAAVAVFEEEK